ncbi:chemotaxis protein CheD [Natronobacterium gregoryi]|nr:chemotaxis protein CheD [Natronobacterium gregoryi]
MLPESRQTGNRDHDAKFADTGIEEMIAAFEAHGGRLTRAWAKLAGGASMFDFDGFDVPIGEQNVEAARDILAAQDVPLRATDVGGNEGRQVTFEPSSGDLLVKTADGGVRRL